METTFIAAVFVFLVLAGYTTYYAATSGSAEVALPLFSVVVVAMLGGLIPALFAIVTRDYDVINFGFPLSTWTLGLVIEIVYFGFYLLGFRFAVKRLFRPVDRLATKFRETPHAWFLVLFIFLFAIAAQARFAGPWSSEGYESAGRYTVTRLNDASVVEGGIERFVSLAFVMPALFVALFAKGKPRGGWVRVLTVVLFVVSFIPLVLSDLVFGARGLASAIVLMLASVFVYNGQWRSAAVSVLIVVVVGALASSGIRAYRVHSFEYRGLSDWQKLNLMTEAVLPAEGRPKSDFLASTILRLDTVQSGGILAQETQETGEYAFFKPYAGAILAPVPRLIWGDKPVPLSINDSVLGTPWYLVASLRGAPWNSVGVSASGTGFWQFWWPGVALTGIVSGLIVAYIARIGMRGGLLGLLFYLTIARQIHFQMTGSIDNWLLILLKTVPLMLIFYFVYRRLTALLPEQQEAGDKPTFGSGAAEPVV